MSIRFWAVVPAAGKGERMGTALPKQYLSINGRTVAEHTLRRLLAFARFRAVLVAVAVDDPWFAQLSVASDPRVRSCVGGSDRAQSVMNALAALAGEAADDDFVLVHDIARPCVRLSDIAGLVEQVGNDAVGGILACRATDTVKQATVDGRVDKTLARADVWLAATPQMFRYGLLRDALVAAISAGVVVTDEAQAVELFGRAPRLVVGASDNIKITRPDDLALAAFWLQRQQDRKWREDGER